MFINLNNVSKNDLLDVIYNYFFVFKNKMIDDDIKFIFNAKDVRCFFNFGKLSREDLYDFVFSIYDKVIENTDDVSYKGNNKMSKSCPEINRSSNPKKRNLKSQTLRINKLITPKNNHLNKFSREYRDRTKNQN